MSSIMRARNAPTGRWEGWEVIGALSRAEGCCTFDARDRMPRSSRPNAHYSVENAPTLTRSPSRESGFVLGANLAVDRCRDDGGSGIESGRYYDEGSRELSGPRVAKVALPRNQVYDRPHSARSRSAARPQPRWRSRRH